MGAVIASLDTNITYTPDKSSIQSLIHDNTTYSFAHNGKIYLNPDVMNSEAAVQEYTHLWDNYIQKTNPELWEKGLNIFKGTHYWEEVKSDPNYADISNDDNLVLSEIHSRICGKMAEKILEKIIEQDGQLTKDSVINWDKETWEYMKNELWFNVKDQFNSEDLKQFLSTPMKDLFQRELNLKLEQLKGNKEKLQALIAQQRMNVAEVNSQVVQSPLHEHCLESASNILQKFGDVKEIYTDGHIFYEDTKNNPKNELNRKDAEKKLSSNGERFTQIQFLGQRFTDNGTYGFNILHKFGDVKEPAPECCKTVHSEQGD